MDNPNKLFWCVEIAMLEEMALRPPAQKFPLVWIPLPTTSQALARSPTKPTLSLIDRALSSPQALVTLAPELPTECPLSTTTTQGHTIIAPACPTVTKFLNIGVACPPNTAICHCPIQTARSTVTVGCVGKCCPEVTPTITVEPRPTCFTGCEGACHSTSFTTVTRGCYWLERPQGGDRRGVGGYGAIFWVGREQRDVVEIMGGNGRLKSIHS